MKKEVCGKAGSTSSLAVRSVIPSLLRFLNNKSKEQASYWRIDTRARRMTGSAMFTFDMSLQKPVDPRKLASSKVHTVTMPLLAQP